jgi:hypothetical protein
MRRLAAHHAGHDPLAGEHLHALPHEHLRVPSARLHHVQEALVAHVAHQQGDLVDVTDDGEQRMVAPSVHARDGRAEPVDRDVVGERPGGLAPDARGLTLVSGRPGSREQLHQKFGSRHARRG